MTQEHAGDNEHIQSPKNEVFAAVNSLEEAEQVIAELMEDGQSSLDDFALYSGEEAIKRLDPDGQQSDGWLIGLVRSWWHVMSDEGLIMEEYEKQVNSGRHIISVHVDDDSEVPRVHEALKNHNAHHINHFGRWKIQELPTV